LEEPGIRPLAVRATTWSYTAAVFVGAALLFLVQPMFARMVLPLLGGSPAVWNTALVFYQGALLAGYGYVHAATAWLGVRRQALVHLPLLALPWLVLPVGIPAGWAPPAAESPVLWLLALLLAALGLPFFIVSATGPLLQRWLAATGHPAAPDPYFLYAASNLGSLLGLLAYPLIVEPYLTLEAQSRLWAAGYAALIVLMVACCVLLWRLPAAAPAADDAVSPHGARDAAQVPRGDRSPAGDSSGDRQEAGRHPTGASSAARRTPRKLRSVRAAQRASLAAGAALRSAAVGVTPDGTASLRDAPFGDGAPTAGRRARWALLAGVPSSLILSVTGYLSSDIAAVPLLWVGPLAIYLLTFVIAFARGAAAAQTRNVAVRLVPAAVLLLAVALAARLTEPIVLLIPLHLATFGVVALACHARLAADRPPARYLTEFYLWLSFGGAVGGAATALVAPLLFSTVAEYPIALVLGVLLARNGAAGAARDTPRQRALDLALPLALGVLTAGLLVRGQGGEAAGLLRADPAVLLALFGPPALICLSFVRRPLRFALGAGAVVLAGVLFYGDGPNLVHAERSFFGVHRVRRAVLAEPGSAAGAGSADAAAYHVLVHGNTVHGVQSLDPARRRDQLAYYHTAGPIGQVFAALPPAAARPIAVVGLGTGSLACYGAPGQRWTFYEIDPAVERIARDARYFTFLRDCPPDVTVVLGDARLSLQTAPAQPYSALVLDAYSSDAIPVHLLTREALRLYLDALAPDGVLLFHISNRHLDLEPVLARLAADAGLAGLVQHYAPSAEGATGPGRTGSSWAIMARHPDHLGALAADGRWRPARTDPRVPLWTDAFAAIATVFRW
jgi:hypothetical protein